MDSPQNAELVAEPCSFLFASSTCLRSPCGSRDFVRLAVDFGRLRLFGSLVNVRRSRKKHYALFTQMLQALLANYFHALCIFKDLNFSASDPEI